MSSTNFATTNSTVPPPLIFQQRHDAHTLDAPDLGQIHLRKRLDSTFQGIKNPVIKRTVETVSASLSRLCDILRIVEINTSAEGPLTVTFTAFSLVHSESKYLIQFIEQETAGSKSIKGELLEALEGTSFVLQHELKRAFSQGLALLDREQKSNLVRADVMRAHGLLSNCFQQSIIMLARVFDPSICGTLLFGDCRERLEQTNTLISNLTSLIQLARQAEEQRETEASDLHIRELRAFCNGPLHYLMYKDWDEFEDIAREVASSYGSARHAFMLHCFATYLEALRNQVQMRAVLNETALEVEEPKAKKKVRAKRR